MASSEQGPTEAAAPVNPNAAHLVSQNLELVEALARKTRRTVNAHIELQDLVAYGSQGLLEAAERYDASRGVAFTTFAYYRIRGAMFDGIRAMGWYSRADYAQFRAEERANEYLKSYADREGADPGADAAPGADPEQALREAAALLSGVAAVHITSLEAALDAAEERRPTPDEALGDAQLSVRVRQAVSTLPTKERKLLELYYFGDTTLADAGRTLGLSKSWACRLHARAVDLLRDKLAADV